jgi:hypothetical protein
MSQTTVLDRPSTFSVFRNPTFTRMWAAQLVSTIGDSFTAIAAGIYVYQRTGSTLYVGAPQFAAWPGLQMAGWSTVENQRPARLLEGYSADVTRLSWSPDGRPLFLYIDAPDCKIEVCGIPEK